MYTNIFITKFRMNTLQSSFRQPVIAGIDNYLLSLPFKIPFALSKHFSCSWVFTWWAELNLNLNILDHNKSYIYWVIEVYHWQDMVRGPSGISCIQVYFSLFLFYKNSTIFPQVPWNIIPPTTTTLFIDCWFRGKGNPKWLNGS